MATLAPSAPRRMAMAWPMPELPPVTRATLSCSAFMVSSSWAGCGLCEIPRPAITEEGDRFLHGAGLAGAAGIPVRGCHACCVRADPRALRRPSHPDEMARGGRRIAGARREAAV